MKKQNSIYTLLIALLCLLVLATIWEFPINLQEVCRIPNRCLIMYRIQRDGMPMFLPVSPIIQGLTA